MEVKGDLTVLYYTILEPSINKQLRLELGQSIKYWSH